MKVIDASVGFKTLVDEDHSDRAMALLADELHAPDFFTVEVTNALHIAHVRCRISDSKVLVGNLLLQLPQLHSSILLVQRALEIAQHTTRRSIYDLIYVALAEQLGCDLVTADTKLINALRGFPIVDIAKLC